MNRRNLISSTAATGLLAAIPPLAMKAMSVINVREKKESEQTIELKAEQSKSLRLIETTLDKSTTSMAWNGHSTVFISLNGKLIITDPVLFNNVGIRILGATFGPRRITKPALAAEKIPTPDVVLLSHAHMDHMDLASLEFLTERAPSKIHAIVAKNTSDVVEHLPWASLKELDWGEGANIDGIQIDALPTKHFGWRLPGEPDRAKGQKKTGRSFNSYLIQGDKVTGQQGEKTRIVFGGDTAYTESFADLKFLNGVDVAIMPIGAYNPWRSVHCNPEEAVKMSLHMMAETFVPIHCMTFPLGREEFHEPRERLIAALNGNSDISLGYSLIGHTLKLT